jgi:parallel beta-helix repeat protein
VAASLIAFLIMLSTAGIMLGASSHVHMKSVRVTPIEVKSLAQYQIIEPIIIRSNVDFATFGATGVGTPSDPYTFDGLAIAANDTCIFIEETTAYFTISNCKLEANDLFPVIRFDEVVNGNVENCKIKNGANGIEVTNSLYCTIENTSIYNCGDGIHLNRVSNCSIIGSSTFNSRRGILIDQSDHCEIVGNSIYSNWDRGLELAYYSSNNSIYGNSIGWNYASGGTEDNARDEGVDNFFDDGISMGNYWSDFNESESYMIPGMANSVDSFARFLEDTISPIIIPQLDIVIDVESSGNTLTWQVYDEFPKSYEFRENEEIRISSFWSGEDITIDLDYLEVGTYAITMIIIDGFGNSASDGVFVSVASFVWGGIGTQLVMLASGITAVIFVVIILLVKRLS